MLPREGRMAVTPHVCAGLIRLPSVSLPTEKGTVAATTLAVGPAGTHNSLRHVLPTPRLVSSL